jgi:hypothetical protein
MRVKRESAETKATDQVLYFTSTLTHIIDLMVYA